MPARHSAITVQKPDTMTRVNSVIVPARDGASSIGASIANLARKPDSGGNPASSSAHSRKLTPSIATGAGITTRLSSSAAYSPRSEEHTSELQSLMRNTYAVFCLKKKKHHHNPEN